MKTELKLIVVLFIVATVCFTTRVKAQTTPEHALRFNIGLETSVPTGSATIGSNFSLGGTVRFQYGITNNFALTITGGAYHFFAKINPNDPSGGRYDSYGVIPLKAGIKEFFLPNIYVGAEAGVAMESLDNQFFGPKRFLLSPAVGYGNKHFDVGLHYENFSGGAQYGLVALRLAYGFGK